MHNLLTAAIWTLSLLGLALGGLIATELVLIPVSLDVGEILSGGVEPWREAAEAAALFAALLAATVVSLRLWHGTRFKVLAWLMTAAELAGVGWFGVAVYRDYF